MELDEIFKQPLDEIQCVRTIGMPCEQDAIESSSLIGWSRGLRLAFFLFFILRHRC
jgi:hypothetical protein